MGQAEFPVPDDLDDLLEILNATTQWNLSFVDENHSNHGWFRGEGLLVSEDDNIFSIFDGDQLMFAAETVNEVNAFLCGCFLSTFSGNSLEAISQALQKNGTLYSL